MWSIIKTLNAQFTKKTICTMFRKLITEVMRIYCFWINYTTPGTLPINFI